VQGVAPARRLGEEQCAALLRRQAAGQFGLDKIDQVLRVWESVPQPRRVVVGRSQEAEAVRGEHRAVDEVGVALTVGVALEGGERLAVAVHSRAVLSSDAVRMRRPSGENTALMTAPVWPLRVPERRYRCPIVPFHMDAPGKSVGHDRPSGQLLHYRLITLWEISDNLAIRSHPL
jgi:hypothetical protein